MSADNDYTVCTINRVGFMMVNPTWFTIKRQTQTYLQSLPTPPVYDTVLINPEHSILIYWNGIPGRCIGWCIKCRLVSICIGVSICRCGARHVDCTRVLITIDFPSFSIINNLCRRPPACDKIADVIALPRRHYLVHFGGCHTTGELEHKENAYNNPNSLFHWHDIFSQQ